MNFHYQGLTDRSLFGHQRYQTYVGIDFLSSGIAFLKQEIRSLRVFRVRFFSLLSSIFTVLCIVLPIIDEFIRLTALFCFDTQQIPFSLLLATYFYLESTTFVITWSTNVTIQRVNYYFLSAHALFSLSEMILCVRNIRLTPFGWHTSTEKNTYFQFLIFLCMYLLDHFALLKDIQCGN